jgi:hypothetical protein
VGLFSSIGKVLKGVSKVAGFIPGIGGVVGKVTGFAGNLLDRKRPMSHGMTMRNPMLARGKVLGGRSWMTATLMRASPVMPGGAISTTRGMATQSGAVPLTFGGGGGVRSVSPMARAAGAVRRRKRRKAAPARKRSTRRLKFGTKAWRARYMKRRRR